MASCRAPLSSLVLTALALAIAPSYTVSAPLDLSNLIGPGIKASEEKYPELKSAYDEFRAGDMSDTIKYLIEATNKYAVLPPPRLLLAKMMLAANRLNEAREQLEITAQELPLAPETYLELGDIAYREKRYTEAGLLFDKARQLLDKFEVTDEPVRYGKDGNLGQRGPEIRFHNAARRCRAGLAAVAEARSDWKEASRQLTEWIKIAPEDAAAHYRLGIALFWLGDYKKAHASLEKAHELDDRLMPAAVVLGSLYEKADNREKAAEWMQYAVRKEPNDVRTRLGMARWLWQTGQLDEAKKHAEKALELDPNSLDAKIMCGMIARYMRNNEEAERYFEEASQQSPSNFTARNQLVLTLIESDDPAKRQRALELAELNVRVFPNSSEAAATLGWVYYHFDRLNDARRGLAKASRLGAVGSDTAYYMAKVASDQGRDMEAIRILEKALSYDGPFLHRDEARSLQDSLKEKVKAGLAETPSP